MQLMCMFLIDNIIIGHYADNSVGCQALNSAGHRTFVRLKKSKIGFVRQNFRSAGHFVRRKIFIAT